MRRWRVHRWTLLAGNGQSQMLCQFDDDLLGGSIIATVPRLQRRILAFSILGNNWGKDKKYGYCEAERSFTFLAVTGTRVGFRSVCRVCFAPGLKIEWQITKVDVSRAGDMAYTLYKYEMTMDAPNGSPIHDNGKDMAVWVKQSVRLTLLLAGCVEDSHLQASAPAGRTKRKGAHARRPILG